MRIDGLLYFGPSAEGVGAPDEVDGVTGWTRLRQCALVIGAALFCAHQAWAHHARAGTYSLDKTVTIEGRVVEFLFRNPHSAVLIETAGESGKPVTWVVEWGEGDQLSRQGIEEDTLKPGDHVIITGHPSRNPADHRLWMQAIARPSDGWQWKISSP